MLCKFSDMNSMVACEESFVSLEINPFRGKTKRLLRKVWKQNCKSNYSLPCKHPNHFHIGFLLLCFFSTRIDLCAELWGKTIRYSNYQKNCCEAEVLWLVQISNLLMVFWQDSLKHWLEWSQEASNCNLSREEKFLENLFTTVTNNYSLLTAFVCC